MSEPRVGVLVFPGTNSEDETLRAVHAVGLEGRLVHWSESPSALREFAAYILPGGFAYEDRIRAGAIAAHDALMAGVIDAAQQGRFVIGICNGAQILLEAGLVPGTASPRRVQAAFAPNVPGGRYRSVHVYVKLAIAPERSPLLAGLAPDAIVPAWASHGEGRLAAHDDELRAMLDGGHLAFHYCDRSGNVGGAATPNGSALDCAGLVNRHGNVLAIMPHPERDAWGFQHLEADRSDARDAGALARPSGGIALFASLARALGAPAAMSAR